MNRPFGIPRAHRAGSRTNGTDLRESSVGVGFRGSGAAVLASNPMSPSTTRIRGLALLVALAAAIAGCGTISTTAPPATPTDFPGILGRLNAAGIKASDWVSGDAGCDDGDLAKTAISFQAKGLDQATPVTLYVYIFRNRDAFERNRERIGPCAASFVTDPDTFEELEQSPYVIASQGPWAPQFEAVLRSTLALAAGTGG